MTLIDVLCSNFVKFGQWEIGAIEGCLPDKKYEIVHAWIVPKICRGQVPRMYSECSRFHPNCFTFGGVIATCMNTAKTLSDALGITLISI